MSDNPAAEIEKFASELTVWGREAGKVANRAVDEGSIELLGQARGAAVNVTGAFAGSFRRDTRGRFRNGSYARRVYSVDPGAMAIEYGTTHQPPRPALSIFADRAAASVEAKIVANLPGFPSA